MKIKIDTKEDSKEDIRKAIEFLKTFVDESAEKESVRKAEKGAVDMDEIRKLVEKNKDPGKKRKEVQEEDKSEFSITPY